MASLMSSVMDNSAKIAVYIYNCKQMGIEIAPPDINSGREYFDAEGGRILFSLAAVKGVGETSVRQIVNEREEHGPYKDLKDFLERTGELDVNKRVVENLIQCGALDDLEGNRRQKMMVYAQIMDQLSKDKKMSMAGQMSLMDMMGEADRQKMTVSFPRVAEYDHEQLLSMEKSLLSIYLSGHPLEDYADEWRRRSTAVSTDFINTGDESERKLHDGQRALIGGVVTDVRIKYTKNNQVMAYVVIEDMVGSVETIVFPKSYERYRDMLAEDQIIWMEGRVSTDDEKDSQLICESVSRIRANQSRELWLRLDDMAAYDRQKDYLRDMISRFSGDDLLVIYLTRERSVKRCEREGGIRADAHVLEELSMRFGQDNVALKERK